MSAAVLVLAHATDVGADRVAAAAARRFGPDSVRLVRPEMLGLASWSHRVDARGRPSTRLLLPNAEPIDDTRVAAVLNRIRYLPVPRFHRAAAKDRDYAGAEMQALVASWLAGFGARVVHVVRQHPWVTPVLPRQHWAAAAAAAGLPVARRVISTSPHVRQSSSHGLVHEKRDEDGIGEVTADGLGSTVLVAGDGTGGRLASALGAGCMRAARTLGFPLLEFRFATEGERTVLTEVDPLPSLVEPWATALTVDLLESRAGEPRS
jgi:hypothetical protein